MKAALAAWIASVAKSRGMNSLHAFIIILHVYFTYIFDILLSGSGPTETNCDAVTPPPAPSPARHPEGPFAPDPSAANCTCVLH